MNHIVPLSAGELLAFALVCASVGLSLGIALAAWLASRDPTTDRSGSNPAPTHEKPEPLPERPRLTPHERRKYRS